MMANMAYCRFQNTLKDLKDCYAYLDDRLSPEEDAARTKLIKVCEEIVRDYGDGDTGSDE